MKKLIITFTLIICTFDLLAQPPSTVNDVTIGTILVVGKPKANTYQHINFPKSNIIIKRGGVADFKRMVGKSVVVIAIDKKKDGVSVIKIKRNDGKRFFGSHPLVSADLDDALKSGELRMK